MKVLILGASGIVGTHMRLCVPECVEPVWYRSVPDPITNGIDLNSGENVAILLDCVKPDAIINLAGESSPDVVEREPDKYRRINVELPKQLARWAATHGKRLVQISSQAVFSGDKAPYRAGSFQQPANAYGWQKHYAEFHTVQAGQTVMRLTFIIGIRPLPHVGRKNPLEAMIEGQSPQVSNRWFSPLMAWDAARLIWDEVLNPSGEPIVQCGAGRWSRYEIAKMVNPRVDWCHHESFPGIAPRPVDTHYAGIDIDGPLSSKVRSLILTQTLMNDRAIELALFFGIHIDKAREKLAQGFHPLHAAVSDEWRARKVQTEAEILEFYRMTEAYIWELSAYHEDPAWNYSGMCEGIIEVLQGYGAKRVLCLGDGIGDLTLMCHRAGFDVRYNDLARSRTSEYAAFRFWRQTGEHLKMSPTSDGVPAAFDECDAIISLDFFEHVVDLPAWIRACHEALAPNGVLMAKNGFGCGSGQDGPIPMHLSVNDKYDGPAWGELCRSVGFEMRENAPDWWVKK